MVDDGKEHGDDRRSDDADGSRHYEERRSPNSWRPTNGFFAKAAAGVAGVVFLVGFLMQILGWRFTGSGADIKANTKDIAANKDAIAALTFISSANTQAIAGVVATTVVQSKDISDIKTSLASMMFVNCAIYTKVYEGAPTISECARTRGIP